jgi:hypothetical protein
MFSLILSQALLMSKLSSKLSEAANLFEIPSWYFSVTSTSLSVFGSKFCLARLLTEILYLSFASISYLSVSQSAPLKERTSNNIFECRLLSIKT